MSRMDKFWSVNGFAAFLKNSFSENILLKKHKKHQETDKTMPGGGSPEKPLKQLHTTETYVIFILKDGYIW